MFAPYHDLPLTAFSPRLNEELKDEYWYERLNVSKFSDAVKQYSRKNNLELRRGDLIGISELSTYRNEYMFIFDGNVVEHLDYDVDDYGSIPSQYEVLTEFPIDYFHTNPVRHIVHNRIVWFDISFVREQLLENLVSIGNWSKSVFEYKGVEYTVYFGENDIDKTVQFLTERTLTCFERGDVTGEIAEEFDISNEIVLNVQYLRYDL